MSTSIPVPNNRYVDHVEPLGQPGVARQLTAGATSASTALSTNVSRISIRCRTANARFVVGVGVQTANASTSHYLEAGERVDIAVPFGASIGYIRAGAADAILEISELI